MNEAATALIAHMEHEEERALPLADRHIGPEGWAKYVKYLQKTQGIGGAAEFLPWALDGVSAERRKTVLGKLRRPSACSTASSSSAVTAVRRAGPRPEPPWAPAGPRRAPAAAHRRRVSSAQPARVRTRESEHTRTHR
ncbi:hypothetical protein NKH77_39525 [Streptomyces sp. M19]